MLRVAAAGRLHDHCPVFQAVGGHAYGATSPDQGTGASIRRSLGWRRPRASELFAFVRASCESVCPMMIPLPNLIRPGGEKEFQSAGPPSFARSGRASLLAYFATRSELLSLATRCSDAGARSGGAGAAASPACRSQALDKHRDMPAPSGRHLHGPFQAGRARVSGGAKRARKVRSARWVRHEPTRSHCAAQLGEPWPNLIPARATASEGECGALLANGKSAFPPRPSGWSHRRLCGGGLAHTSGPHNLRAGAARPPTGAAILPVGPRAASGTPCPCLQTAVIPVALSRAIWVRCGLSGR